MKPCLDRKLENLTAPLGMHAACLATGMPTPARIIFHGRMVTGWRTDVELERDLRSVQAMFLFGLLGVISYYRIAIGKNMKGMILAYGLYIATSLASLAVRSYAYSFDAAWNTIEPFSYLVSVSIWLTALWSYHPSPVPALAIRLETDYEDLVSRTQTMMGAVRSHFAKAARP